MGTGGYKITDQGAMYFVSFAVVGWIDVFTRKDYREIVIESLKYCEEKKG
jgi:putative transposase